MSQGAGPNKYSHTPRRVFERSNDRLRLRIDRNQQQIRALERVLGTLATGIDALWDQMRKAQQVVLGALDEEE